MGPKNYDRPANDYAQWSGHGDILGKLFGIVGAIIGHRDSYIRLIQLVCTLPYGLE